MFPSVSARNCPTWRRLCVLVTLASFLGACAESSAYRTAKTDEAHRNAVDTALLGVGVQAGSPAASVRQKSGTASIKTNVWDKLGIGMVVGSMVLTALAFREFTTVKPTYWKDVEVGHYLWPAAGLALGGVFIGYTWGWQSSQPQEKP